VGFGIDCLRWNSIQKELNFFILVIYIMNIEFKPHQLIPIEFMKTHYGLLLFHSTGSGKTITALASLYNCGKKIIIIGPKSSRKAFVDNIKKLNYDETKFEFYSYQKMKNIINEKIDFLANYCVIIDEAHHLRNETRDNMFLADALSLSHKIILLTATPVINYLNDISTLINIVKKSDVLPTERRLFDFLYFDENTMQILNEHLLKDKFKNCISFYEQSNNADYPKSTVHVEKVIMTKNQLNKYAIYLLKIIYNDYSKEELKDTNLIDLFNIKLDFINKRAKNSFLTATRQISNTVDGSSEKEDSSKIIAMYDVLIKGKFPVIVYSNFLKNGIYPLINLIDKNKKITYKVITGSASADKVNVTVNLYNKGLVDIIFISSAGSESLDFKNTRQIHIMEPHWNEAKIRQVIGRSIRYKSHNDLPEKDRHVDIYKWISIFPEVYANTSADEYLIEVSEKKDNIFKKFKSIIIESSIEQF